MQPLKARLLPVSPIAPIAAMAFCLALVLSWAAAPAKAVDGVIEISAAAATAGGGYPVDLVAGSYVLTSNLIVPSGLTALRVLADDVSIDLNGFTIDGGSGGCTGSGAAISCPAGTGTAIDGVGRSRVAVRDGYLRDFAKECIVLGDEARVRAMHVTGCSVDALSLGADSQVRESIVTLNGGSGISAPGQLQAIDNISYGNGSHGIRGTGNALISGNIAVTNGNFGISSNNQALIRANISSANEMGGIDTDNRSRVEANVVNSNPSGPGIFALDDTLVQDNAVISNGLASIQHGIECRFRCNVVGNAANGNTADGINVGGSGSVNYNAANGNGDDGIECDSLSANSCSVLGNTAVDNIAGHGLEITAAGAVVGIYKANTFDSNGVGDVSQAGLDPAPGLQNTCSGTVPCP